MIAIKVTSVNHRTDTCEAVTSNDRKVSFSTKLIRDGDKTPSTTFSVKGGAIFFVDEEIQENGEITGYVYTSEMAKLQPTIDILKDAYLKERDYPLIGDIVIDESGRVMRFYKRQVDYIYFGDGAFFFYALKDKEVDPSIEYSGGSLCLPESDLELKPTGQTELADFWSFKDWEIKAGNRVDFKIPVRVWKVAYVI